MYGHIVFFLMDDKEKNKLLRTFGGMSSDHFVDSIEEEIREENMQKMWQRYGKIIVYTTFAILIGVAVYNMWQKQNQSELEAISYKFSLVQNAIMTGEQTSALTQIRGIAQSSKKNYSTLAKFEYAAMLREKNQIDALDEYKSIYNDKDVSDFLRSLAYIFYVTTAIDLMSTKEIAQNVDVFIDELNKNHIGKYWDLLAKEALAYCYIKKGDNSNAKIALQNLAKTQGIPNNMAERANMLLQNIGD